VIIPKKILRIHIEILCGTKIIGDGQWAIRISDLIFEVIKMKKMEGLFTYLLLLFF